MEHIVDADIEAYLAQLQRTRDAVLAEMEARAAADKFPIVGPLVGRLCQQVGAGDRRARHLRDGLGLRLLDLVVRPRGRRRWPRRAHRRRRQAQRRGALVDGQGAASARACTTRSATPARSSRSTRGRSTSSSSTSTSTPIRRRSSWRARACASAATSSATTRCGRARCCSRRRQQDADTRGVVRYNKEAFGTADLLTTIVPISRRRGALAQDRARQAQALVPADSP